MLDNEPFCNGQGTSAELFPLMWNYFRGSVTVSIILTASTTMHNMANTSCLSILSTRSEAILHPGLRPLTQIFCPLVPPSQCFGQSPISDILQVIMNAAPARGVGFRSSNLFNTSVEVEPILSSLMQPSNFFHATLLTFCMHPVASMLRALSCATSFTSDRKLNWLSFISLHSLLWASLHSSPP